MLTAASKINDNSAANSSKCEKHKNKNKHEKLFLP